MKTDGVTKGLEIKNLRKSFGRMLAVDDLSLTVNAGDLVSFLGPSGCGKTTTLRMIGGLEYPDGGEILVNGHSVMSLAPWQRNCGFVFQSYALFPHMTVRENIQFGMRLRKWSKVRMEEKVSHIVNLLGIENLLERKPKQISGGQQQRVAVARALAIEPDILLMDEPLANLDAKLRDKIRIELRHIQQNTGVTTVYVTHDQDEAFSLSDLIVVMNLGKVEQVGTPFEIFTEPASEFVASFVGNSNILRGCIVSISDNSALLDWRGTKILGRLGYKRISVNDQAIAIFRVDDVELAMDSSLEHTNVIEGRIQDMVFMGGKYRLVVVANDDLLFFDLERRFVESAQLAQGSHVRFIVRDAFLIPVD